MADNQLGKQSESEASFTVGQAKKLHTQRDITRNVRTIIEGLSDAEIEKLELERLLSTKILKDNEKSREDIIREARKARGAVAKPRKMFNCRSCVKQFKTGRELKLHWRKCNKTDFK